LTLNSVQISHWEGTVPEERTYRPGAAFDLTEAQRPVAQGRFALAKSRAFDALLEECDGERRLVRPAAQGIFSALTPASFVERAVLGPLGAFDVYGAALAGPEATRLGVQAARWYVKFGLRQEEEDRPPVFVISMHPAEHWPIERQCDVAKRRVR
jgi:hypothetical protein